MLEYIKDNLPGLLIGVIIGVILVLAGVLLSILLKYLLSKIGYEIIPFDLNETAKDKSEIINRGGDKVLSWIEEESEKEITIFYLAETKNGGVKKVRVDNLGYYLSKEEQHANDLLIKRKIIKK